MIEAITEEAASEAISVGVLDWLRQSGYDLRSEVQVLTPIKAGEAGTIALNGRLQAVLNPTSHAEENEDEEAGVGAAAAGRRRGQGRARGGGGRSAESGADGGRESSMEGSAWYAESSTLLTEERALHATSAQPSSVQGEAGRSPAEIIPRVGDSMIQLTNDYGQQVFNGDIGRVRRLWREGRTMRFTVAYQVVRGPPGSSRGRGSRPSGLASLQRERELLVEYTRSALGKDVALSYALTVHKAQGAEHTVVVMPVLEEKKHAAMLNRNLLYTGLSRAKVLFS
uniref:UvrD-like helicase C-terminal domain-containing protein n=1 Tax=Haptolina brevifila TaxID=156173 RepID=A0A7S2J5K6_9EUKA|mmetsp:Transcript_76938/g.152628  ORF Transcript_76938/g.152628 Transcript_76938/m.152628 type:complete len:283 (+) Transcript_76938:3-851(+)